MAEISEHRRRLAGQAGVKAQKAGKPRSANSRERGTIYYDDWADGYDAAERGEV